MNSESQHIHPIFDRTVARSEKQERWQQAGSVFWFTGLSGSGKSTIALGVERRLFEEGKIVQLLDGDNIRTGLNNNLGFSEEDRLENIRRIAEVAKLFAQSGVVCLCSFVSPTISIRKMAQDIVGENDFNEVFVNTPLELCESRDVKGLYAKARKGEIKNFTGIDAPYEAPQSPWLEIKTAQQEVAESVDEAFQAILQKTRIQ